MQADQKNKSTRKSGILILATNYFIQVKYLFIQRTQSGISGNHLMKCCLIADIKAE
jgi:hypothetical protein